MPNQSPCGWNYQPFLLRESETYPVDRLLLYSEVNRLPYLIVRTSVREGVQIPRLGDKLELSLQGEGGRYISLGKIRHWHVEAVARLPILAGARQPLGVMLQLTALPGQTRPMRSYVRDIGPMVSDIIQGACNRFVGVNLQSSGGKTDQIFLETVVSVGETFEQFTRRLAVGINHWFLLRDAPVSGTSELAWQDELTSGELINVREAFQVESLLHDGGKVCQYPQRPCYVPALEDDGTLLRATKLGPHCAQFINSLPLDEKYHVKLDDREDDDGERRRRYYLGDAVEMSGIWPGCGLEGAGHEDEVVLGVLHVFDTKPGSLRTLYEGMPGTTLADFGERYTDKLSGHYGVLAITGKSRERYLGAYRLEPQCQLRDLASRLGRDLGLMPDSFREPPVLAGDAPMLATVLPWKRQESSTWAAAGRGDNLKGHTSLIRVRFDWSEDSIRVPFAYPMNGESGIVFLPPGAGDRVLVMFDRLWPILACSAWQYANYGLTPDFERKGGAGDLGGARGISVRGGVIFKSLPSVEDSSKGDMVLHAAGDLYLRADGNIYLDSSNIHEGGGN